MSSDSAMSRSRGSQRWAGVSGGRSRAPISKRSLEDTLLLLLRTLKLPSFAACYEEVAARGEREGWSFGQYLNHLAELLDEIPKDQSVVVHCAGGYRSAIACSLLMRHGFEQIVDLVGGLGAWEAAKLEIAA